MISAERRDAETINPTKTQESFTSAWVFIHRSGDWLSSTESEGAGLCLLASRGGSPLLPHLHAGPLGESPSSSVLH